MNIKALRKHEINYCDQSGLNCFARCPAKYYFERILGLRKPDRRTDALDYGTAMHEALPLCYTNVEEAIEVFTKKWLSFNHEDSKNMSIECAENSLHDFSMTHQDSVCPYIPLDPPETIEIEDNYSDKEIPFLIDIEGVYPLAGRIDRLVKWKNDNRLWPLDYKTSAEISARIFNNFEHCLQVLLYTLACTYLTNERCPGMIIEFIRKSPKNAENQMNPVFVSDAWLETGVDYVKALMGQISICNNLENWSKHPTGCASYGMFGSPGYTCDYSTLCNSINWQDAMKFYNIKKWDPFVVKKEEGE